MCFECFKTAHFWDQLQLCRNFQYLSFFGSRVRNKKVVKYISWRKKLNAMNPFKVLSGYLAFLSHPLSCWLLNAWSVAIFQQRQNFRFVDDMSHSSEGTQTNFFSNPVSWERNGFGKTSFSANFAFSSHEGPLPKEFKNGHIGNIVHLWVGLSECFQINQKCLRAWFSVSPNQDKKISHSWHLSQTHSKKCLRADLMAWCPPRFQKSHC